MYSGAVRRKRVSEQVTPVEARTITGTSDIKYGSRGGEAPKSHLRVASSPPPSLPTYRPVRLAKQGLPVLRGRAGLRASSSGKWLTAYIYLPLAPSGSYPTTLYTRLSLLSRAILETPLSRATKDTNRLYTSLLFRLCEIIMTSTCICIQMHERCLTKVRDKKGTTDKNATYF